LINFI